MAPLPDMISQPEVWFYHLTSSTLMKVLPPLLVQVLKRDWRCVVQTSTSDLMRTLDNDLWTFSDSQFIPHARRTDNNEMPGMDNFLHIQPVYITDTENDYPNTPDVILCVESAAVPLDLKTSTLQRFIVIFDGTNEAELTAARTLWKDVSTRNMPASYWTQNKNGGGWEKKNM